MDIFVPPPPLPKPKKKKQSREKFVCDNYFAKEIDMFKTYIKIM